MDVGNEDEMKSGCDTFERETIIFNTIAKKGESAYENERDACELITVVYKSR